MEPTARDREKVSGELESLEDHALVFLMAGGREQALGELLHRHWGPLLGYVRSILEDSSGVAEDVVQHAFLDLWEASAAWEREGSVRSYLYRAARHRALNHIRRSRVHSRATGEVERRYRERHPNPTPLETLEQRELREALDEAIAALPPRRREVFTLGYLHGFTYREIAETMAISLQTVKNQMSSALGELRRSLAPFLSANL